jgi:hypothetical protein
MKTGPCGHGHSPAVHLLGGGQILRDEALATQQLIMDRPQPRQSRRAIGIHVDPDDPRKEGGTDHRDPGKRLKE